MLLRDVVEGSRRIGEVTGRNEKIDALAGCLRRAQGDDLERAIAFLSGRLRTKRPGIGWSTVRAAMPGTAAGAPRLTLAEVEAAIGRFAAVTGAGSTRARTAILGELLARATPAEQDFLARLFVGELRQGALEGVMLEAVARALDVPPAALREATMVTGDLAAAARPARAEGAAGLSRLQVRLFRPIKPMLAQPAQDVTEAIERHGRAGFEYKLDGARVQIHKSGDAVRVWSRRLNEVTAAVPEVVETVASLPARELILDGETIALREDGRPQPFQVTMRRFGRRLDVERLRTELPLALAIFDCLWRDGAALLARPAAERFAVLAETAPGRLIVPRLVTGDAGEADAFFAAALAAGHEGVMAKSLDAPYAAGERGGAWLKLKRAHTLDLVVLAAEWGNGRRRGWLSNLHLGARDPETGGFVMLGKTFKGMTDAMLAWQTERLLSLATSREGHVVHVRPELVVEIAFDDIQQSPHYPGGLALRFARVKAYRTDKRPDDADTIDAVRDLVRR